MRLATTPPASIPVLAALLAIAPAAPAEAQPEATRVIRKLDAEARLAGQLPFLLYRPPGYDASTETWPLLVFLHGSRGSGYDPTRILKYPIPKLVERGEHDVPFLVLAPQAPSGKLWPDVAGLMELIEEISASHRVDRKRIYLTGQSIGGEGVWHAAYRHPGRFAAIAPISGAASPFWAERLAGTPTWVFHGALDAVVPVSYSDHMVEALERRGATVLYTRYEDRGHQPPTDDELASLLDWFLEHRLVATP